MYTSRWDEEFKLPDGSNSVLGIQDYFEYVLKKHEESVDKPYMYKYMYENGENITHLEITEGVLVHCDIANNDH